jgi:hypothetical protein
VSDYTGRVIVYGYEMKRDGVVVEPRCPTCHRFVSSKKTTVRYSGWDARPKFRGWRCPRCGPFQPNVLGWGGDFGFST